MFKRIVAACLFLAGGLVTWVLLSLLQGYAASQAAMSAGPISGARGTDTLVLWLLCAYFLISAVSAVATTNRHALWALCSFAHALIAIAFCFLCSEMSSWDAAKLIPAILTLLVITGVFLLPWLAIWCWVFEKARKPDRNAHEQLWAGSDRRNARSAGRGHFYGLTHGLTPVAMPFLDTLRTVQTVR